MNNELAGKIVKKSERMRVELLFCMGVVMRGCVDEVDEVGVALTSIISSLWYYLYNSNIQQVGSLWSIIYYTPSIMKFILNGREKKKKNSTFVNAK